MRNIEKQQNLIKWPLDDFLALDFGEQEFIVDPILPLSGSCIIYAKRGVGKSFLALSLGLITAGKGQLFKKRWTAPESRKIIYVDGEMSRHDLQRRLLGLCGGLELDEKCLKNFEILPATMQKKRMPNLANREDQKIFNDIITDVDLLIIDNLATLCLTGDENSASSWEAMQQWVVELKARNKSVILVHHAGKNDNQRGSSAHEDIVDTSIHLRRPANYKPEEGARFCIDFCKTRGFAGEKAKSIEARIKILKDGLIYWDCSETENQEESTPKINSDTIATIRKLTEAKKSIRDIADILSLSKSTVHRHSSKYNN